MATQVKRPKSVRHRERYRITYTDTFLVIFDADSAPSGWTQALAEAAVITAGYTIMSAHTDAAACYLRSFDTTQHPKSKRMFLVRAAYKSWDDDPAARSVNDERVAYEGGTQTFTEYYDNANDPLDDSEGKHGVQKLGPTKRIRVTRIHSSSKSATADTYACKVNSATVTTPGGVTLSSTAKELLFLYASERQIDDEQFEVTYYFEKDLRRVNSGTGTAALLHKEAVATVDKSTGKVTSVTLKEIYETAAIGSAMADE